MKHSHFLIGVDSDGTAFDSMTRKHIDAFIPAALEIWPMNETVGKRFAEIEKTVNLFSELRGINRFPGLLETFERLETECAGRQGVEALPDLTDLRAYVSGVSKYSPTTLQAWIAEHPSDALEKVLQWSERADELFTAACEGLPPYEGVTQALEKAAQHATVAVVSSAAKAGLEKDWTAGGLMRSVDLLMSQEDGSKTRQLQKAMAQCRHPVQALMIGDTDSDGIAAHEAGAMFYPIMPGNEEASWRCFVEDILPRFLKGQYTPEDEAGYYGELKRLLG